MKLGIVVPEWPPILLETHEVLLGSVPVPQGVELTMESPAIGFPRPAIDGLGVPPTASWRQVLAGSKKWETTIPRSSMPGRCETYITTWRSQHRGSGDKRRRAERGQESAQKKHPEKAAPQLPRRFRRRPDRIVTHPLQFANFSPGRRSDFLRFSVNIIPLFILFKSRRTIKNGS